jgi:hypothetical protein
MNTSILKSSAFWITAIGAIVSLLISQGVILSGSTLDHVLAYAVALIGALIGHSTAAPASTPPAA